MSRLIVEKDLRTNTKSVTPKKKDKEQKIPMSVKPRISKYLIVNELRRILHKNVFLSQSSSIGFDH